MGEFEEEHSRESCSQTKFEEWRVLAVSRHCLHFAMSTQPRLERCVVEERSDVDGTKEERWRNCRWSLTVMYGRGTRTTKDRRRNRGAGAKKVEREEAGRRRKARGGGGVFGTAC
jgi:hypothetical protein